MRFIDVVNFNGDASCLATEDWLRLLKGGAEAPFHRWLRLYVDGGFRVVLGLPGATASDIAHFNPESIALIRDRPDAFQVIVRPYAHDLALVRTRTGFVTNLAIGKRLLTELFGSVSPYYLPPEFMLTSDQVGHLCDSGLATFVFADRLDAHVAASLPKQPFPIVGTCSRKTMAIPFHSQLTRAYLQCVQMYHSATWQKAVAAVIGDTAYCWRDGESIFLLPDPLQRESFWLGSGETCDREFLPEPDFIPTGQATQPFPLPSFSAWVREMKMHWYIGQIREIEVGLEQLRPLQKMMWLQAINSDILSSIEKPPPVVDMRDTPASATNRTWMIPRHNRALEGEDYLNLLLNPDSERSRRFLVESQAPHMCKLRGRLNLLETLPKD